MCILHNIALLQTRCHGPLSIYRSPLATPLRAELRDGSLEHQNSVMVFHRCSRKCSRTFGLLLVCFIVVAVYVGCRLSYAAALYAVAVNPDIILQKRFIPSLVVANVSKRRLGTRDDAALHRKRKDIPYVGPKSKPLPLDVNIVLHNASMCDSQPDLRWVFYVHSAPANQVKRDLIRATWGDQTVHVPHTTQLVFMLGKTTDRKLQVWLA